MLLEVDYNAIIDQAMRRRSKQVMRIYFIPMAISEHFLASMGGNGLSQRHQALRVHLIIQAGESKHELSQFNHRVAGRMYPAYVRCTPG